MALSLPGLVLHKPSSFFGDHEQDSNIHTQTYSFQATFEACSRKSQFCLIYTMSLFPESVMDGIHKLRVRSCKVSFKYLAHCIWFVFLHHSIDYNNGVAWCTFDPDSTWLDRNRRCTMGPEYKMQLSSAVLPHVHLETKIMRHDCMQNVWRLICRKLLLRVH